MLIKKLMTVCVKLCQVHLCFNIHILINEFFGCGIVKFTKKQCDKLKKTHELPNMPKMGLGNKFPRKVLHVTNQLWEYD